MTKLTRRRKILAKVETTYGTDAAPTAAADAVLLRSLTVTPLQLDTDERTLIRPYLGSFEQIVGMTMVKVEAELELAGFGTAGPASPTAGYDALLRACALQRVVTAGSHVDYNPVSAPSFDSLTVYYEMDGVIHKAYGCRGTLTLDMATGKIPSYKVTLTGTYGGVADGSVGAPVVSAYQTPLAVNSANTTALNLFSTSDLCLRSFSLDLGNVVNMSSNVGCGEVVQISDRQVSGKCSIESPSVATFDALSKVAGVALGNFDLTHGPAGNQVVLSAPSVQLTNPTESDDNGVAFLDFDMRFLPVNGNDEIRIRVQ